MLNNLASDNSLFQPGNKSLSKLILTQIYFTIWHHWATPCRLSYLLICLMLKPEYSGRTMPMLWLMMFWQQKEAAAMILTTCDALVLVIQKKILNSCIILIVRNDTKCTRVFENQYNTTRIKGNVWSSFVMWDEIHPFLVLMAYMCSIIYSNVMKVDPFNIVGTSVKYNSLQNNIIQENAFENVIWGILTIL